MLGSDELLTGHIVRKELRGEERKSDLLEKTRKMFTPGFLIQLYPSEDSKEDDLL